MFKFRFARPTSFHFLASPFPRTRKCLDLKETRTVDQSFQIIQKRHTHNNSFKILFLGRDEFSCLVLQALYAARDVWQEIYITTYPDEKTGRRGSHLSIAPLKTLARSMSLPIHTIPHTKPEFRHWKPPSPFGHPAAQSPSNPPDPHHVLVTASFGRILPSQVLHLFAPGRRLNVHPSSLPAYRGAAPIQRALMNGETETGVCIIEMMEFKQGIDAGEIWGRTRLSIPEGATFASLRDTLGAQGGKSLVSILRKMLEGKAESIPQSLEGSTAPPRAHAVTAADSMVNFASTTAADIVRMHNAISHQRPLTTYLPTRRSLQLHSPSVSHATVSFPLQPGSAIYHPPSRALLIRCAENTVLSVPRVKQQDRMMLEAKEWWNGIKGLGPKVVESANVVQLGHS